jgi:acetate kinase
MGFSTLDGVVMGTRCGALDPGAILHLLREGASVDELERLLYRESGLLGVSGLSPDVRDLLASSTPDAREALDCFVWSIVRALGSMIAMLGGLDALVFTAGIGENSAWVRSRVAGAFEWTGLDLDKEANEAGGPCLSRAGSRACAWTIPTDEEGMLAVHAKALLFGQNSAR